MKIHEASTLIIMFIAYSFSCGAEELIKPGVKLPGIYSVWKGNQPDDTDKPSITLEELQKCMSNDMRFQQQYESFKSESAAVDNEITNAEVLVKDSQQARQLLETEASAINLEKEKLNNRAEELNRRRSEFSEMTSKKVDPATAKKINAQIDQFNKDINNQNANSLVIKERVDQFLVKQKNFNDSLASLKMKLDQVNEKTAKFNEKKKQIDSLVVTHRDKCEGERKLDKSS